jgi:putative ABC transport system permease protein
MVEAVAGEAELEVSSPVGDVSEGLVEECAKVDGVSAAAGVIEQFLPLGGGSEASVYVLGIDFLGSNLWRDQFPRETIEIDDELAFLAQADSVAAPVEFLRARGHKLGDSFVVVTPAGARRVVIRGTITDAPAAKLFGGAIVLMDLPAAQKTLQRENRVDRIAIDAAEGVSADRLAERLRQAIAQSVTPSLAESLEIMPPEARGEQAERLLFSLRTTLAIMSLGAVIVGAFIVYHTIAISVLQRRREFALLNACGVSQKTLVRMCVGEAMLLSVPGAAGGVVFGRLLAAIASGLVAGTASQIWVPLHIAQNEASILGTLVGCIVGIGTALGAAYVAIRGTLAAPTVETLRPAGLASEDIGAVWIPMVLGGLLVASSWLVLLVPPRVGYVETIVAVVGSHGIAYIGVAVLAAPVIWLVGVAARRWIAWRVSLPGTLAAEDLPRQPGRSAGTVATIAATMGIAVVVVTLIRSFESGWMSWIEEHFGADLFVGRGEQVRLIAGAPMPIELAQKISEVHGVASVEPFRTIRIQVEGMPLFLQGVSVSDRLARSGLLMVEGDLVTAGPRLLDGTGVLLSENLSYKLGLHRGDVITLPTPNGSRRFVIQGVYVDYLGSLDLGAVLVAQHQLEALWGDRSANLLRVWLRPQASPALVAQSVRALLEGSGSTKDKGSYYVLNARDFLKGVQTAVQRFFAATWALEFIAALVGVIGVVNTQLATVLDRATEIGVLRTIGVSRKDIIRSVVIECGALGALGGVLGVALGLVLGAQIVLVSLRLVTGWSMAFHVPWGQLGGAILIATVVSALAGYVPARAAAGLGVGQRSSD